MVEFVAVPYACNPSRQQALLPFQTMSVAPAFVCIQEYHKTGEKASLQDNVARQVQMAIQMAAQMAARGADLALFVCYTHTQEKQNYFLLVRSSDAPYQLNIYM